MRSKEQCRVLLEKAFEDLTTDDIIEKIIDYNGVKYLNEFVEHIEETDLNTDDHGSE